MNKLYDTISNWQNSLTNTYTTRFIEACGDCHNYMSKGFTRDEASEILISKGYGSTGIEEVLDEIYGPKISKASTKKIDLYVVPTKYNDIMSMVEYRLAKSGPDKFIKYLTEPENPIIGTTEKHKKSLLKLANNAYENVSLAKHLHNELEPYLEEAMLNSVLIAEQQNASIQKIDKNKYFVEFPGRFASVDLDKGNSTSNKFTKSNYGKFGLADEFLIKAHDTVSPFIRLRKILIQQ